MTESPIMRRGLLALSAYGARVFRIQVGTFFAGKPEYISENRSVRVSPGDIVLRKARTVDVGITGMHDIIGWKSVTVTPAMIDKKIAVFSSFEAKSETGSATPEQINFRDVVLKAGGMSGIFQNDDEAIKIIEEWKPV